jgi:hypothetical protein
VSDGQHDRRRKLTFAQLIAESLGHFGLGYCSGSDRAIERFVDDLLLLLRPAGNCTDVFHASDGRAKGVESCLDRCCARQPRVRIIKWHRDLPAYGARRRAFPPPQLPLLLVPTPEERQATLAPPNDRFQCFKKRQ